MRVKLKNMSNFSEFVVIMMMSLGIGIMVVCGENMNGNVNRDDFPSGFVFGAGSSAYQMEGAAEEYGRTPSIWDTFAHSGYMNGATGDLACDAYHKYKEDVQLMVETGLDAFRLSISWSRLIPNGRGPINPKGLQFYNNFINELVSHGIEPHVTLHHVDLPQVLEDEYGGWTSRKIIKDFTEYADVCFREFGDRVKHWTTINEVNVFAMGGYDSGAIPPKRCSHPFGYTECSTGNSSTEPYIATHHMLLAHASAARLYEKNYKTALKDEIATQRANEFFIGWICNPLIFGDYPDVMKKNAGSRIPAFTVQESDDIRGSFDFLGLNYYLTWQRNYSAFIKQISPTLSLQSQLYTLHTATTSSNSCTYSPCAVQDPSIFEYQITPWGLTRILEYIKQHYNNPLIYIHENGQRTQRNKTLEDWSRVEYLQAHIGTLLDSIRNGSNVKGYFIWSFMDYFEMLDGYESGFGLYYVDLDDPDLKRQPKLSAHWYSDFLKRKEKASI